jgi:hypothetical protein
MRLIAARKSLDANHICFEEFYTSETPAYAILSHTWDHPQEITYGDCNQEASKAKEGFEKVINVCRLALQDGVEYAWVDTCCIDKSSSAELTEAINSMFVWYQQASFCYAYLADLDGDRLRRECHWFHRGWTLQELIAPGAISMRFYNKSWTAIGSKHDLLDELYDISQVDAEILSHAIPLSSRCVARRLSWAAGRETTRVEDMAYCLLGIFGLNMPMLYGEGHGAFRRFQEELIRSTCDLSLLAWTPPTSLDSEYCGFFADSVKDFASCSNMMSVADSLLAEGEMTITNKGLKLHTPEYILAHEGAKYQYALKLDCKPEDCSGDFVTVPMRKIGPNTFVRARTLNKASNFSLEPVMFGENELRAFTLLTKLPDASIEGGPGIVSSSRYSLVQVELPPGVAQSDTNERPLDFWDVQDCSFFGTRSSLQNWGVVGVGDTAMFICFWHKEGDVWTFRGTLIEEDMEDANGLWYHLFNHSQVFGYAAPSVKAILSRFQSKDRMTLPVRVQGTKVNISYIAYRADDPTLCSGPRWKVEIKLASRVRVDDEWNMETTLLSRRTH